MAGSPIKRLDILVFAPGPLFSRNVSWGSKLLPMGAACPIGVVAHQTQCRDANIGSLDSFFQQIVEINPVRLVNEDILTGVPA